MIKFNFLDPHQDNMTGLFFFWVINQINHIVAPGNFFHIKNNKKTVMYKKAI